MVLPMLPFDSVFIASSQTGFEDVRAAAREGVESLGLRALMAETVAASPEPPREALLQLVERADVLLLIIGPRYGEPGRSGRAPTEDEFEHARGRGTPVLVLVQDVPREPEADAFLGRVRGNWDGGLSSARFTRPEQVVGLTVRSLRELGERLAVGVDAPAAQARAVELAQGESRQGYVASGVRVRVALVPLGRPALLDALRLDDPGLVADIAGGLRAVGLVPQSAGIEPRVTSAGVACSATLGRQWERLGARVDADGTVVIETDVAAEGLLGGMQIDHARVISAIDAAQRFAQFVWERIDTRREVRQVAAAVAVPEADGKLYVVRPTGNSSRIPMGTPAVVVAPDPALILRREDVGTEGPTRALAAALKRAFADHEALHE